MTEPTSGEEFGGALEELRRAARINLPRLANEYETAGGYLTLADRGSTPFSLPGYFQENGPTGKFYTAWSEFNTMLYGALNSTASNFELVADALGVALEAFCDQDQVAADELLKLKNELEAHGHGWKEEFNPGTASPPEERPEMT